MKDVAEWRWMVTGIAGKRHMTRYHMDRETALERDPTSTPVEWTKQVRSVPDTQEERDRLFTSMQHIGRKPE